MDTSIIVAIVGAVATVTAAIISAVKEWRRPVPGAPSSASERQPEGPKRPLLRPVLVFLSAGALGIALTSLISTLFVVKGPADSSVPIGGIVPYWGDWVKDNAILTNFELCDGEPVKAKDSPIAGIVKPKLVGRFLRGADQNILDVKAHPLYGGVRDEDTVQTEGHALVEAELAKHTHPVIEPKNGHSHPNTPDFIFREGGGAERLLIPNASRGQGGVPRIPQELPNGLMGDYPITQPAKTGITLGYTGEGRRIRTTYLGKIFSQHMLRCFI
jgi:hypothetical protein